MPRVLRMPSEERVPDGPNRKFIAELFMHYREAGRPSLRDIAGKINEYNDHIGLRGTASTETIRRVLSGAVVPRNWYTVEAILVGLCGLAGRNTGEDRWPEDQWSHGVTFADELKQRWNAAIDAVEGELPQLPPRPSPPSVPTPSFGGDDPWATSARSSTEDPPF